MSFKNTEIGLIPSEWGVVKLGTQIDVLSGYAFKSKDFQSNGVPVIKIKNITPPNISLDDVQFVSEDLYESSPKYHVLFDDILISMTGSNYNQMSSAVGKVGRVRVKNKKMLLNQRVGKIVPQENKCNKDFIYHILATYETQYRLALSAGGSANQANISPKQICDLLVPSPPIEEQKAIAVILSALDKKIEVNNRINKTLENMAQEIFKRWFVDFEFPNEDGESYKSSVGEIVESELGMIPRGWEIKKLNNFADITMGQSPQGYSLNENGEGEVFYQGRTDFSFRFPSRRIYTNEPKRLAYEDDILLSVRAPVGDINIANEKCCIGRGLAAISSKSNLGSYLLYLLKNSNKYFSVYNGTGTVFGSINQNELRHLLYAISPDYSVEAKFNNLVKSIDAQIKILEHQSKVLCDIRDVLLPKLMSGEIRVQMEES